MHPYFERLTHQWFKRAFVYTGSIGEFRFRFAHNDDETLHCAAYSHFCYEKATDVVEQDFPWTDEGVEKLKIWLQERLDTFEATTK